MSLTIKKYLFIISVFYVLSSCGQKVIHATEPDKAGRRTYFIDSASGFYPYVDSTLPFIYREGNKVAIPIHRIEINITPNVTPLHYVLHMHGKVLIKGYPDSAQVIIDDSAGNWPNPPRNPKPFRL